MKLYGLVGYPLSHSFSKRFFTEKFKREKIDAEYKNFELEEINVLRDIISENTDICGINVTIPYKEKVIPLLDKLDSEAAVVGAVNTVQIIREKDSLFLKGFNSDITGFENSISPLIADHHRKALILGTGGASKAIKHVLRKMSIDFISASIEDLNENEIRYEEIDKSIMDEYHIIINATPLGTSPNIESSPDIPYHWITKSHLLFDLVYNPEVTRFLQQGATMGAVIKNGYEMLTLQALKSYEIWTEE